TAPGSTAVTPVVAVAISIVDTTASIGSQTIGVLSASGALTVHAEQDASASAKATGSANAGGSAVGFSIGFTLALHSVTATTGRSLASGGAVTFEALGISGATSEAKASAGGAADETDASRTKPDSTTGE